MANETSYKTFEARINQIKEELKEEQKKFIIYKLKKIMELVTNNNKSMTILPYEMYFNEETEGKEINDEEMDDGKIDEDYTLDSDEISILYGLLTNIGIQNKDVDYGRYYDDLHGDVMELYFRIEKGMLGFDRRKKCII